LSTASRRYAAAASLMLAVLGLTGLVVPTTWAASSTVGAMRSWIYQVANPQTQATLTTPWSSEAVNAAAYGFTVSLGSPFQISTVAVTGLSPVRRLYHGATGQFAWALLGSADLSALTTDGYVDQGTSFFAASASIGSETSPVVSMRMGSARRLAVGAASPR